MQLVHRAAFPPKGTMYRVLFKQYHNRTLCPVSFKVASKQSDVDLQTTSFQGQFKRSFHVTKVNRDLEAGLRALGAGVAATGVIGSGIGLGVIFGNLLAATARNPSLANKIFGNAVMGAAFCESLGLFSIMIAFVVMP